MVLRLVLVACCILVATTASAQSDEPKTRPARYFVSGAAVVWSSFGAVEDPPGKGYLQTHFHGPLDRPAAGIVLSGGVYATPLWTVGAEAAAHWPTSSVMSEDYRTKYETRVLSSTYRERQMLLSLVVGRQMRPAASVGVRPVVGLTVSRSSQSLEERHGIYAWYGGTLPSSLPDESSDTTKYGGVAGADVHVRAGRTVSIQATARVHWIRRPENAAAYWGYRDMPSMGPVVAYIGAGVTWRPRRAK